MPQRRGRVERDLSPREDLGKQRTIINDIEYNKLPNSGNEAGPSIPHIRYHCVTLINALPLAVGDVVYPLFELYGNPVWYTHSS